MDGAEPDDGHEQPAVLRRRDRLRAFMSSSNRSISDDSRASRMPVQMPSLLRRFTSRRSSTAQPRSHHALSEASDTPAVAPTPRRGVTFANQSRSPPPQFSYIHQQTVTTISDREEQELAEADSVHPVEQDDDIEEDQTASRTRRRRLSLQMSNFFSTVTSPRNRARMLLPSQFCNSRPLSPTSIAESNRARSRVSIHEPLAELDNFDRRPPTPAEVRVSASQEELEGVTNESEYEHGYTPRRRRPRPQPFVAEPHDGDYIRRRGDSRQARRATWGPTAGFPVRNNSDSIESFSAYSQRQLERLSPSTSNTASTPPLTSRSSIFSRALSNHTSITTPPEAAEATRPATPVPLPERHSFFRPTMTLGLRNRVNAPSRRQSRRLENWADAATPDGRIPLAELQRLLTSYAAQSGSDRDPDGHSETTVDGGTITIYGIRRVSPRTDPDVDDDPLFPPATPTTPIETQPEERQNESRLRGRRRRPRRIFNFYGLNELESIPRDLEETFDRLRRTRRPRSMFGSGSLRRNGVVEPDVPSPSEGSSSNNNEDSSSSTENDETWIFYIVSAVLPEGHPLLSAPSLFTDNPTYEDMLFLDSFLHKPVASRTDVATAPGLYRIHRRSGGELYASGEDMEGADIEIETERCLICLSDFDEGEEARMLVKCEHFFHKECIDTWLTEGRNSCPLCRGEGVEKKQTTRASRASAAASSSATTTSSLNVL